MRGTGSGRGTLPVRRKVRDELLAVVVEELCLLVLRERITGSSEPLLERGDGLRELLLTGEDSELAELLVDPEVEAVALGLADRDQFVPRRVAQGDLAPDLGDRPDGDGADDATHHEQQHQRGSDRQAVLRGAFLRRVVQAPEGASPDPDRESG